MTGEILTYIERMRQKLCGMKDQIFINRALEGNLVGMFPWRETQVVA
jgi:hypothetical protein